MAASLQGQALDQRYLRNHAALSEQDQQRLASSRICLLGLGGLGGPLLEMLARMGFGLRGQGWIRVADGDVLEPSNLNRQLLCLESNLGHAKARAARDRIDVVNSEMDLQAHQRYVREEEMPRFIQGADIVLDALGDLRAKLALRGAAARERIPLVTAAVAGWVGFISTLLATDRGDALPEIMDARSGGAELTLGVPAPTVWLMAALQCREAVALACNHPPLFHGRMHVLDLSDASWAAYIMR